MFLLLCKSFFLLCIGREHKKGVFRVINLTNREGEDNTTERFGKDGGRVRAEVESPQVFCPGAWWYNGDMGS